ncbi:ATP-binding protein [Sulfurimonas lithotrophica]|uniref:ATP-binding protein n=1 Tax=Sulfurimonas lithotrophica TaxID=2590022 RepID=A0A5P8NYC2_9BACT|nr:ATP-binding protein [Sulfurimonas lithotrophica]QFR48428.1 ATP-binding protein [Sulfurimonas lithotrophica]
MQNLLEEFYKTDLIVNKFQYRKLYIEDNISYQINGISQVGKTKLVKNYLLSLKKNTYIYIDCSDVRIDIEEFNKHISKFCIKNRIDVLVYDNYTKEFKIPNVSQLIITSQMPIQNEYLTQVTLYPLDYEEFLAYEHKYDSTALNHFVQLGGYPAMHKINSDERITYIQKSLQCILEPQEFEILKNCAKMTSTKLSPFSIYERLKQTQRVSKDKLYKSYDNLVSKNYIHQLSKFNSQRATKKIYLCDISLKSALVSQKHFGRLFENMLYLELLKHNHEIYYEEGIDFYLPQDSEIILSMPFADERTLFKKVESIEAFIITYGITQITAITMNNEATISHPFSRIEMIPFDIWALGD